MKITKVNIHGIKICDASVCRKHKNLTETNEGIFCKKHLIPFERVKLHHHLSTRRGSFICHALHCTETKNLEFLRGGKFCKVHSQEFNKLRKQIKYYNKAKDLVSELQFRIKECHFVKFTSLKRWQKISDLQDYLDSLEIPIIFN